MRSSSRSRGADGGAPAEDGARLGAGASREPGPAQAAQRNYLQSLHAEVAEQGVYVGMLYIGAAIEHSAFHTEMEQAKAAGDQVWEMPSVDPAHLADLLWTMHRTKGLAEATYPEILFKG